MSSQQILLGQGGKTGGQAEYNMANTYTWTCPDDVTSISVVCVGAGGACGNFFSNWPGGMNRFQGGGGGACAYANNITVTPGNTYEVLVAAAGSTLGQTPGPHSHFLNSNGSVLVRANSGGTNNSNGTGGDSGTVHTGTGGAGGHGGANSVDVNMGSASGAGAGGYSGSGGGGRLASSGDTVGFDGQGGGGGGGGAKQSPLRGGGGGGVGLQGEGPSGEGGGASLNISGGEGGSGGSDGNYSGYKGGVHGGGGGYWDGGGVGGVRIIWPGDSRQFPSTDTADV